MWNPSSFVPAMSNITQALSLKMPTPHGSEGPRNLLMSVPADPSPGTIAKIRRPGPKLGAPAPSTLLGGTQNLRSSVPAVSNCWGAPSRFQKFTKGSSGPQNRRTLVPARGPWFQEEVPSTIKGGSVTSASRSGASKNSVGRGIARQPPPPH